ncbi:MAG: cupin domain-containing protein [Sphingomonadales bacterium]|nr:cupin domain-containing protein [Sphingomonadales bacterium]
MTEARSLERFPLHLGLGAKAVPQPEFSGMAWYGEYGARNGADGPEGRLVSLHTFSESWTSWEMHPAGDEVVVCTAGEIVLIQQLPDGGSRSVTLHAGEYAVNPPGVWHTADVADQATALFITAGMGTENRPR